ncbi:MAG TPA: L-aspartate oxidase [Trichocoleus sp.]
MPDFADCFDVLIIGGGAAGLYAALCLPQHYRVGLITKETLSLSASDWAQGGIAAAIDPEDSPKFHIEDTLRAGAGLCEPEAVKLLVEQAPQCIQALVQMGVAFDRSGDRLALTLEAAHSHRRVLHAADTTGRALINTLVAQVLQRPNVQVISQAFVLDLWIAEQRCQGVSLLHQSGICWLRAKAVLLATGGGGQVFAQTTNPAVSTGDGVAMAWRQGAQLRDLEFVQFHPTALTKAGAPRFLISEAVRGEGAHLVDATGYRFAFDYHPAGELAPRDIVSRAIYSHIQKTAPDPATAHVWLDLRPIPAPTIQHRFPNIIQVCQQWGIDVFHEPIPVAPAAHYWMGGITTDTQNRTTIAGLYAVGETASTGVHGANRLASNSLLECLVFGAQLAHLELPEIELPNTADSGSSTPASTTDTPNHWQGDRVALEGWRRELPRLIWQCAGICRDERSLLEAVAQVALWQQEFLQLSLSQTLMHLLESHGDFHLGESAVEATSVIRLWGEVRNLLDVGYLILKSAAFRTESRGGHYRTDFSQLDPSWQVHTLVESQQWRQSKPIAF